MKKTRHAAVALAAATFATISIAQVAHAAPGAESADGTVTRTIAHSDLDLRSNEGKRILESRIRHSANELCNNDNLTSSSVRKRCKAAALQAAGPQVQNAVSRAEAKR